MPCWDFSAQLSNSERDSGTNDGSADNVQTSFLAMELVGSTSIFIKIPVQQQKMVLFNFILAASVSGHKKRGILNAW